MNVIIYQSYSRNRFPLNIFSILIRWVSGTNYSHYALAYDSESGNRVYCDSTPFGVRQSSEFIFLDHNLVTKGFKCHKDISRKEFLAWFEKHQGKSYGFGQILGLLGKILNMVRFNPFGKGAKRIICNELIILFLNEFYNAKIKDIDSLDLNDTEKLIKVHI